MNCMANHHNEEGTQRLSNGQCKLSCRGPGCEGGGADCGAQVGLVGGAVIIRRRLLAAPAVQRTTLSIGF